jgi:hypothetical protein
MTTPPESIDPRVWELSNKVCEGTISEQEARKLEALLRADRDALTFYVDLLKINSEIQWLVSVRPHSTLDSDAHMPTPERAPIVAFLGDWVRFFNQHSPLSYVLLFMIVCATLVGIPYLSTHTGDAGNASDETMIAARITCQQDCQWSITIPAPAADEPLRIGQQLRLDSGLVQLTYSNGATVLLQGPADYKIDSLNSGCLASGKLTARCDAEQSHQFAILTPGARFVDLGTEFGVMIDDKGRSAVAVFAGKVNAEARLADGKWDTPVALSAGEAVICEEAKFAVMDAQRDSFPFMTPPPPPPPESPCQRWLAFSQELRNREDLLAYYDFQQDPTKTRRLPNRSASGAALDGTVQNAKWAEGRFAGKNALEFKINDSGVSVDLPRDELSEVTLVAWVNVTDLLKNEYSNQSGIVMSDGWATSYELHWFMRIEGRLRLAMQNKDGSIQGEGIGTGTGILGTQNTGAWTSMTDHLGQWCMLAGVYDAATGSITHYFNGVVVEKITLTETPRVRLGAATICGWCPTKDRTKPKCSLKGRMDELMIFRSALSADEISKIYEAGKP